MVDKTEKAKADAEAEKYLGGVMTTAVVAAIFGAVVIVVLWSMVQIPAGHAGVLLEFGAAKAQLGEGLHFIIPIMQNVAQVDMRTQKVSAQAASASSDLQTVSSTIALNYHIAPEAALKVYQGIGMGYSETVISPAIQESVKASTAQFTAEELISKRLDVRSKINDLLISKLAPYGIVVESIAIENFDFSPSFNAAIEAKVTAEQNALREQRNLEMVKFQAQQTIEAAYGQANATLANAKANAMAIELQGKALRENPDMVQLKWIEKWNGAVPVFSGSNALPLLNANEYMPATGVKA